MKKDPRAQNLQVSERSAGHPPSGPESTPEGMAADDLTRCLDIDEWEFEELLEQADQVARTVRADRPQAMAPPARPLDAVAGSTTSAGSDPSEVIPAPRPSSSLPWLVLTVGLATLVCGSILIGWSLLGARPELWSIGLPMVLGGQISILAVVVWQFESVWQTNKATFYALHGLDSQVRRLQKLPAERRGAVDRRDDDPHAVESEPHIPLADLQQHLQQLSQHLSRAARSERAARQR